MAKFTATEVRMVVDRGWGEKGLRSCHLMGIEFQFCKMENFWRWVAQQCELYCTVDLKMAKMVNFILCVFYHEFLKSTVDCIKYFTGKKIA